MTFATLLKYYLKKLNSTILFKEKWVPHKIKEEIKKVQDLLRSVKETSLKLIVAAPTRPKPLKLYEPNIQQV